MLSRYRNRKAVAARAVKAADYYENRVRPTFATQAETAAFLAGGEIPDGFLTEDGLDMVGKVLTDMVTENKPGFAISGHSGQPERRVDGTEYSPVLGLFHEEITDAQAPEASADFDPFDEIATLPRSGSVIDMDALLERFATHGPGGRPGWNGLSPEGIGTNRSPDNA